MTVYVKDIYGPQTYEKVTKVEWINHDWFGDSNPTTRIVIHQHEGDPVIRHIDDIVKIEGE